VQAGGYSGVATFAQAYLALIAAGSSVSAAQDEQ
jgi:hypothetical protein